jgi:hypothetical protein
MERILEVNLQGLLEEIRALEKSVVSQLAEREDVLIYKIKKRKVFFEKDVRQAQKLFRLSVRRFLSAPAAFYLVAPVIYSMIIPAIILDSFTWFYQRICFPVYGIPLVLRKEYISMDRHRLSYLNWIEKVNCDYCGYFNGVISFTREVASRTEQYFCPIRHALRTKGLHPRQAHFVEYGDAAAFREKFKELRDEVQGTKL